MSVFPRRGLCSSLRANQSRNPFGRLRAGCEGAGDFRIELAPRLLTRAARIYGTIEGCPLADARPDRNRTNKLFQIIILNGSEREDDPDACLEHIQPLAQHARKDVVAKIDLRSNRTRQLELHATAVVDGELGAR